MPIYEYKCRDCGTVSELLVGVTADQASIACEDCGSEAVDRLLSQISFTIQGMESSSGSSCGCGGSCGSGSCGSGSCGSCSGCS